MAIKELNPGAEKLWENFFIEKSTESRNRLIEHYYPYVKRISVKVAERLNWNVQPEELASFGIDGLYKAIDGYSPERGVKFESYANQRIRGSMIDGLRREDAVPRSVRVSSEQFRRHKQRLQNHFGRNISDSECAQIVGMNESEFNKSFKKFTLMTITSIDSTVDNETQENMKYDSNSGLIDKSIEDPSFTPVRKEFFSKLMSNNFSSTERKIVHLYYYKDETMEGISKKVGLSESRISQMHKKIIEKLQDKIKRNPKYFGEDLIRYLKPRNTFRSL